MGFWRRAPGWFWSNDMPVDEVLADNGPNFVSDAFAELLAQRRILHRRTRPYRPQTNGKAERFNRTVLLRLTSRDGIHRESVRFW